MLTHNQEQFIFWVKERESIRLAKNRGLPKPWTKSKVMQETYFCNVNREDDKVTKWIRDNWTYPYTEGFEEKLPTKYLYTLGIVAARVFNLPSTLERIKQPVGSDHELSFWLEHVYEELREIEFEGERIWNGAYIISTNGKKMSKIDYCLGLLRNVASSLELIDNEVTLAGTHKQLMKVDGLGSFLAAQIVADLKNTEGHPLADAKDWWTFSAPGPGSLRGLSWFFEEKISNKNYQVSMDKAFEIIEYELPEYILDILCAQNLQNCFCEYDKFMRVTNQTGRSKRKYQGV